QASSILNRGFFMTEKLSKEAYSEKYDVFLSYRRDGGETMAILLRDRLSAKGYRVFLDIESLNSGSFNTKLLSVIEESADFVVVCSKNCLDRCVNENDWVRQEIAHAIKHNKNIVPIMLRGFEWPATLPADIDSLPMQNGINAGSNEFFDAVIDRLAEKFLVSVPEIVPETPTRSRIKTWAVSLVFLAILAVSGIVLLNNSDIGAPKEDKSADANISHEQQDTKTEQESAPSIESGAPPKETTTAPPQTKAPEPVVINIKGVEYNVTLFELDLSNKNLTNADIAPLRLMKNIEVLNLGGNQVSDLSPISGLTNLKKLSLYDNNRISDLTPLKNLTNLTMLSLYFNPIGDISVLSNMTKLEELYLSDNKIKDITPISSLTTLAVLSLNGNQIKDLKPLSGLVNLRNLSLKDNQINDLTPLSGLSNLTVLNLSKNQINDLTPLSGLANLRNLSLSDNQIDNWSPVAHVKNVFGRP
ncbi:MAG: leucine-rich repeat domain-containing protein, partial [Oscillospiraceae bacterium]|nr:leucine-rich repeat domain-containing protein [Oscillospiraceae bacterium]